MKGDRHCAGIVGGQNRYNSKVEKCYNIGHIEGTESIGGITGELIRGSSIKNSYNKGKIDGNKVVGGIVGSTNYDVCSIGNSYNIGNIVGDNDFGGVIGKNNNGTAITNCYYLKGTVGEGNSNTGIEKTKEELKSNETIDILNDGQEEIVWETQEQNEGYPTIKDFYKE